MVEESEERLTEEQIEELIQTVADVLPGDPEQENSAPADAEMDEASEQSWQATNYPQVVNWSDSQDQTGCLYHTFCISAWSEQQCTVAVWPRLRKPCYF